MADEKQTPKKTYKYHTYKPLSMTMERYIDESKGIILKVESHVSDKPNPNAPNGIKLNEATFQILVNETVLTETPKQNYGLRFEELCNPKINLLDEETNKALNDLLNNPTEETAKNLLALILPEPTDDKDITEKAKTRKVNEAANAIAPTKKNSTLPEETKQTIINTVLNSYPEDLKPLIEARVEELLHPTKPKKEKKNTEPTE